MKATSSLKSVVAICLAWNFASPFVLATDQTDSQVAYEAVQSGIKAFAAGDLESAAKQFEQARSLSTDSTSTDNTIIRFDQACVDLAKGQQDSAKEKLRQAVAGSDPEVVQSAHYNLGFLKVQQVKAKLQPDPATVAKKVRTEVVDELEQAARHFRSTLEINPDHEDAAYNLELIRMFLKQLKTLWKQQDEQQQEPDESLTDLLLRLQESFQEAEQRINVLQDEPDSASRQTAVSDFQLKLREVDAEVKKVRPLFDQWLQTVMPSANSQAANQQDPTQPPSAPSAEQTEAIQALTAIVDQLEATSENSVASIATEDWPQGKQAAKASILLAHQLFLNVASYQETLQAALTKQQKLNSAKNQALDDQITSRIQQQQFVSDLSQALSLQAEQQLPQVEQQLDQLQQTPPAAAVQTPQQPQPSGSQPAAPPTSVLQADEQKAQLEGLRESMFRAIQLAPSAVRYSNTAANKMLAVESEDTDESTANEAAQPSQPLSWSQGKVLRLLQDIAEPLQDPNSDQQQSSGDQDSQNSEEDQQQPEDQNSDQQDSGDDSPKPDQKQPEESAGDESQGEDDQQQEEEGNGEPKALPAMAEQQAKAILRKATEREQEYRELKKRLEKFKSGQAVKKDW